ncbi:MAG: metallophosphoesterase [Clostridiales bacterium]|nr:metallophosphoesterase [Clostridiales bacterium]
MSVKTKLDAVFEKAFPVPFDDSSKFVFFSDVHRGDDSLSDEFGRNKHIFYHALNYYYENDFTYVEVGDGDELWEHPNFEFIRSAHTTAFEMLKKFFDDNRFFMLFGNHNMRFSDEEYVKNTLYEVYDEYLGKQVELFPGITVHEALVLKHRDTGQELFVVHGHQGGLMSDRFAPLQLFFVRFLWRFMHTLGVKYAASPAKSRTKRHKVEKLYTKWNENHDTVIICGHTHRPKFPTPGEPAYFNSGCCMHPRGITCLELIYGKFILVTWSVSTKRDGSMYIKRTALKGPEPIKNYTRKTAPQNL